MSILSSIGAWFKRATTIRKNGLKGADKAIGVKAGTLEGDVNAVVPGAVAGLAESEIAANVPVVGQVDGVLNAVSGTLPVTADATSDN